MNQEYHLSILQIMKFMCRLFSLILCTEKYKLALDTRLLFKFSASTVKTYRGSCSITNDLCSLRLLDLYNIMSSDWVIFDTSMSHPQPLSQGRGLLQDLTHWPLRAQHSHAPQNATDSSCSTMAWFLNEWSPKISCKGVVFNHLDVLDVW